MLNRIRPRVRDFAVDWAWPICWGLATAVVIWTVWHFTKAPCTTTAATNGLCNPSVVARFIDVEILLKSGGAALAVGALKGGYDRYMMRRMLNEERELRLQAEQQLADERRRVEDERQRVEDERQRVEDERQRVDEAMQMVVELVGEFRADIQQAAEERRQNAATQQALLDAIARLTERGNGHAGNGD